VILDEFGHRQSSRLRSLAAVRARFSQIPEAIVQAFSPSANPGGGSTGGFPPDGQTAAVEIMSNSRRAARDLTARATGSQACGSLSSFPRRPTANVCGRESREGQEHDVPLTAVFDTLQIYLGRPIERLHVSRSLVSGDRPGGQQVPVGPADILKLKTRNTRGQEWFPWALWLRSRERRPGTINPL